MRYATDRMGRGIHSGTGIVETLKSREGQLLMRIGVLADKVGVSVATIRFYEEQGLLDKPARSDANYRTYGTDSVKRLGFVIQCRSLGISTKEIRRLLALVDTPDANCGDVDVMLDEHISKVREQRRNLAKLEKALVAFRQDCHPSMQVRGCGILRASALVEQREEKRRKPAAQVS